MAASGRSALANRVPGERVKETPPHSTCTSPGACTLCGHVVVVCASHLCIPSQVTFAVVELLPSLIVLSIMRRRSESGNAISGTWTIANRRSGAYRSGLLAWWGSGVAQQAPYGTSSGLDDVFDDDEYDLMEVRTPAPLHAWLCTRACACGA